MRDRERLDDRRIVLDRKIPRWEIHDKFLEWAELHYYQSFALQPDTDWLYSSREDDAQP